MERIEDLARALSGVPVVVTGASGFIGHRLTLLLAGAGARVTVLMRARHEAAALRVLGVTVVPCDLAAGQVPVAALAGCAVLFHFAYDMRASGADNLRGFDALLAAAGAAGVGRIVHASSAVVYDGWPDGRLSEASASAAAGGGGYRQAKIAMERRLMAGAIPAVIVQPTIVYGPGSALWTDRPIAQLQAGGIVLPDPPGLCAAVHVDDVVQAAVRAAVLPDPGRERFLISGPDRMTWADFFAGYVRILGQGRVDLRALPPPPPPQDGPASGPSLAARISAQARRVLGRRRFEALLAMAAGLRGAQGPALPDPGLHRLYAARPEIDMTAAQGRLGYIPTVDFSSGLATIADHLHLQHRTVQK